MLKAKRSAKKPSVNVKDLHPKEDPKGGYCANGKHLTTGLITTK